MTSFSKWDIIVTDFPFADNSVVKRRPSLICTNPIKVGDITVYWVLMITSSTLQKIPSDVQVKAKKSTGLPVDSYIRTAKIACIDENTILKKIGIVGISTQKAVNNKVVNILK